jgi:hypothetical protein
MTEKKKRPGSPQPQRTTRADAGEKRAPTPPVPKHQSTPKGGMSFFTPIRDMIAKLPYTKMTAAQTHNLACDLVGAVVGIVFIFRSDSAALSLACFFGWMILSFLCMNATDRRRRF